MTQTRVLVTVSSPRLVAMQRWHAMAFNLVPLLATIGAVWWAFENGVSALDIGLFAAMYLLSFVGIEVGFHRHFAHGAFAAKPWLRVLLAGLGATAAQGPVIYWVANHRRHHKSVDREGDPHSPYLRDSDPLGLWSGLWHAHMGWLFGGEVTNPTVFAKDCQRDPLVLRVNAQYFRWILLGLAAPMMLGALATQSLEGALTALLWGGAVRMFVVQQLTFAVNSFCHRFGTRRFSVRGYATNNAWLAVPTLGGAWHHNHHAFPFSAVNGFYWWEVDVGAWVIRLAERIGWVWNVRVPSTEARLKMESR
jgi:stearoyl-CoA desaturase (delta-9 desaturase)